MIMTATEYRSYVDTDESDELIGEKLSAIELMIRAYTNNNFQVRAFRSLAVAMSSGKKLIVSNSDLFKANDTLQISESELNTGLVTVRSSSNGEISVKEELYDESGVLITKVVYPADIRMGVVNLMKWETNNREKVGVQSESISRHTVTYFSMDGDNSTMGYPKSLLGFLNPYKRARFGQGLKV